MHNVVGHLPLCSVISLNAAVLSISNVKEKAVISAQFLTDNIEHGMGCVEESDYRVTQEVIKGHRLDLHKCRVKLEAERAERPSMAGVRMPARGVDNVDWEWARQRMPPHGTLSKDSPLHMR